MIIQYEVRQELHSASSLIGENRLIKGPFASKEEASSEAAKSPLRHLFVVEKTYSSEKDLQNHFWSDISIIPIDKQRQG